MKLATTLLIFTAVVCTSRIEALWFNTDSTIGSLTQSISDNVKKAQDVLKGGLNKATEQIDQQSIENPLQSISNSIDKAVDMLKNGLNKAKEQADQVTEKLQEAAEKVTKNVKEAVDNVQKSVDKQVNELTEKAESEGVDVSECKKLVKTIREAASTTVKKTISCIPDTIGKAKDAFNKALTSGRQILEELKQLKKESEDCLKSSQGILQSLTSTACQTSVKTRTAWLTATAAPGVIKDLVLATKEIVTLPTTLPSCVSQTAIATLTEQGMKVVDNVKQCIAEKTGKKTEKKEESTGDKRENEVAVDRNPLNWIKKKVF